jgi:hypothetical protein
MATVSKMNANLKRLDPARVASGSSDKSAYWSGSSITWNFPPYSLLGSHDRKVNEWLSRYHHAFHADSVRLVADN